MAEEPKKIGRWKIPFSELFIVKGDELRQLEGRFEKLEREFKTQLLINEISSKMIGNLQYRINVMTSRIPAPHCPKCFKPLTAGGIQWIDHVECCKPKKKKPAGNSQ